MDRCLIPGKLAGAVAHAPFTPQFYSEVPNVIAMILYLGFPV